MHNAVAPIFNFSFVSSFYNNIVLKNTATNFEQDNLKKNYNCR